ncbi:MAG: hypothetical protein EOP50_06255 [Sphingobacteriales bacterium]|nr:MAG: hypothetical protein EOP50_06255 [Sphingobacteriales bacterium]
MNVGQLRKMIEGVDDSTPVLIPLSHEFDGRFYSPCAVESGMTEMASDNELSVEDVHEMELLGKDIPMERNLMLAPCGFSDEKDHTHELN